jgi:hypothetical protein
MNTDALPGGTGDVPLATDRYLASALFARFDEEGIGWCHWKSNEHLLAALRGETDLDILVGTERLEDVYRIVSSFGFRRGRVAPARNEPGLEDFFGVDNETGRLVHLHVHWRLASGERHLKRFRLPWERDVLASRVRDEATGAYVTAPAQEVVLVFVRAALKLRWRDRVRLRRREKVAVSDEARWLMGSTTPSEVEAVSQRWLGTAGADAVDRCRSEGATGPNLLALRRIALRGLALHTSHRGASAAAVRLRREAAWLQRGIARHYVARPVLHGRGGSGGGLLVAVIGADGSGKSTLTRDLREWFAPKFDTLGVYFGSGDGPASWSRLPLKIARDRLGGAKDERARRNQQADTDAARTPSPAKVLWAVSLAHEKRRKLERVMLARTRGMLVITDRYPQVQFPGSNDGPLLGAWNDSPARSKRAIARWEARPYELADRCPPDLILRLNVDTGTASGRRPGHGKEFLARRIDIVSRLTFHDSRFGVIELDSSEPFDKVFWAAVEATFGRL